MAITFLNSTGATIATAASTWSIVPHSSLEGGAGLVLGIGMASSGQSVSTVTDAPAGNVWRRAVAVPTTRPVAVEMWYATGTSSNSTRISITLSGASSGTVAVAQFLGISTANALSVTGSSAQNGNSTVFGASVITPPTANQVVVSYGMLTFSSLGTITNLSGMTTWISTSVVPRSHGMYEIQGAASTQGGDWKTSSRGLGANVIAAFSDTAVMGGARRRGLRMFGVGG